MKKLFLIIAVMCLVGFTSCKSEEEKTEEAIYDLLDEYMFENLPSYPDAESIEMTFEPEYYDYVTDSMMMYCGHELVYIDRGKQVCGFSSQLQAKWLGIMDTIRILLETIDTTQQRGYFITHRYRTTNHIGAYEIRMEHFFVSKDLKHIEPYIEYDSFDKMIMDIYLPAAFTALQDDDLREAVINRRFIEESF